MNIPDLIARAERGLDAMDDVDLSLSPAERARSERTLLLDSIACSLLAIANATAGYRA